METTNSCFKLSFIYDLKVFQWKTVACLQIPFSAKLTEGAYIQCLKYMLRGMLDLFGNIIC